MSSDEFFCQLPNVPVTVAGVPWHLLVSVAMALVTSGIHGETLRTLDQCFITISCRFDASHIQIRLGLLPYTGGFKKMSLKGSW
jgi:hypothetical protein